MNDYTKRIREELSKIQDSFIIKTIHDSNLTSAVLPYLDLSEELISSIQGTWNDNHVFYENGKKSVCYAPYVSQTIIKYCQNRDKFKRQYSL